MWVARSALLALACSFARVQAYSAQDSGNSAIVSTTDEGESGSGSASLPRMTPKYMIDSVLKCMTTKPEPFSKEYCTDLTPAGAGSRSLDDLMQAMKKSSGGKDFPTAVHVHGNMAMTKLREHPGKINCFAMTLREPAARLESLWKDKTADLHKAGFKDINEYVSKTLHLVNSGEAYNTFNELAGARAIPLLYYLKNWTGVASGDAFTGITSMVWQGAARYLKEGRPEGAPEIEVPDIKLPPTKKEATSNDYVVYDVPDHGNLYANQPIIDVPLIDCEAHKLHVEFICLDDMNGRFQDFVKSIETGELTAPPSPADELRSDLTARLPDCTVDEDVWCMSEDNRKIVNEVFYALDYALYRYKCLGDENVRVPEGDQDACTGCKHNP